MFRVFYNLLFVYMYIVFKDHLVGPSVGLSVGLSVGTSKITLLLELLGLVGPINVVNTALLSSCVLLFHNSKKQKVV